MNNAEKMYGLLEDMAAVAIHLGKFRIDDFESAVKKDILCRHLYSRYESLRNDKPTLKVKIAALDNDYDPLKSKVYSHPVPRSLDAAYETCRSAFLSSANGGKKATVKNALEVFLRFPQTR